MNIDIRNNSIYNSKDKDNRAISDSCPKYLPRRGKRNFRVSRKTSRRKRRKNKKVFHARKVSLSETSESESSSSNKACGSTVLVSFPNIKDLATNISSPEHYKDADSFDTYVHESSSPNSMNVSYSSNCDTVSISDSSLPSTVSKGNGMGVGFLNNKDENNDSDNESRMLKKEVARRADYIMSRCKDMSVKHKQQLFRELLIRSHLEEGSVLDAGSPEKGAIASISRHSSDRLKMDRELSNVPYLTPKVMCVLLMFDYRANASANKQFIRCVEKEWYFTDNVVAVRNYPDLCKWLVLSDNGSIHSNNTIFRMVGGYCVYRILKNMVETGCSAVDSIDTVLEIFKNKTILMIYNTFVEELKATVRKQVNASYCRKRLRAMIGAEMQCLGVS